MTNGKCRYIVTGGWWGTGGAAGDVGVRRDVEGAGVVEMPGGGPNVLEMV
ncbi:hypothetical protein G4421_23880, partial [Mycobacterium avium]|nr:hypothetical protein [Mycobacterium avium]